MAFVLMLACNLEHVTTLVMLSFILAYVLNPLVTYMAKPRFMGRGSATLITMIGLIIGFIALLFFIIPEVVSEFRTFIGKLPALMTRVQTTAIPWIERTLNINLPGSWDDAFSQLRAKFDDGATAYIAPAAKMAGHVFGTTFSAFLGVVSTLMLPLFLFFILKEYPKIIETVDTLVPPRNRETVHALAKDVDKSLSAFLHGQFMVMLVLGTLYSVGYSIVGTPVAIGLGMLTGLLCFIPYIGAATGFLMALLLAALAMNGWGSILGVIIVFGVVQALDAVLITPKILGGKLGLKPLWIIVALMAGGELFGFLGVLLAVPTTAVLKIFITYSVDRYKQSSLFLSPDSSRKTKKEHAD